MKSHLFPGIFIFLFSLSTLLSAQNQEVKPVTLDKLTDNLYQISGGRGANGGLFVNEAGALVIDAKMDEESVKQTLSVIRELTDKPIRYLVNTHSDGDHVTGNRFFPKTVTFVAHENCRADFFKPNYGRESDWGEAEFAPFVPSLTFTDRMNIWMGSKKIELYYFGVGHTTGDMVIYFADEKVAFIGDQYFSGRPQLIHSHKNGNSFEHIKTLANMLETIDAEQFCSGHSDVIGREDIKAHIQTMVDRQAKVNALISENKTQEEVLAAFPENEARLVTSIFNEIRLK